jgi:radical SAM protein with 4Fe4S-binding SPASM domain
MRLYSGRILQLAARTANQAGYSAKRRGNQVMRVTRIKAGLSRMFDKLSRGDSWRRTFLKLRVAYVAPTRPQRFPTKLQIEATSKCNLRCPACSHAKEKGNGQHLTEQAFRKILDDLPWSPARVVLSGIGEPLINPDFFSLVDVLAERGIKCEFFTNGTLLTESRRQAILSRSNIDTVNISCDGSRKDTFESLRVGANFETWKELVREFLLRSKQQRGRTLDIGMNVVVSKQNRHEIGDILRLAAEMGFGNVYVIDLIPVDDIATSMYLSDAELSAVHQELVELAAELGLKVTCFLRRQTVPPKALPHCLQPWDYMLIRADGAVVPCCAVFGSEQGAVMGNILEQDFRTIWLGERYREFRRSSASGANELCRICPSY